MCYIPDNADLFEAHDRAMEAELEKLPKCSECNEPIQGDYGYYVESGLICEHCLNAYYRVDIEDLM